MLTSEMSVKRSVEANKLFFQLRGRGEGSTMELKDGSSQLHEHSRSTATAEEAVSADGVCLHEGMHGGTSSSNDDKE